MTLQDIERSLRRKRRFGETQTKVRCHANEGSTPMCSPMNGGEGSHYQREMSEK